MMRSLGENLTQDEIKQMMKFADLNKDGAIDFEGNMMLYVENVR